MCCLPAVLQTTFLLISLALGRCARERRLCRCGSFRRASYSPWRSHPVPPTPQFFSGVSVATASPAVFLGTLAVSGLETRPRPIAHAPMRAAVSFRRLQLVVEMGWCGLAPRLSGMGSSSTSSRSVTMQIRRMAMAATGGAALRSLSCPMSPQCAL